MYHKATLSELENVLQVLRIPKIQAEWVNSNDFSYMAFYLYCPIVCLTKYECRPCPALIEVFLVQPARGKTQKTKPRKEVTHEGNNHPRGECGTENHTKTNTTTRPGMVVSPVNGANRGVGPAEVAEQLPERDEHHCASGGIVRPTWRVT